MATLTTPSIFYSIILFSALCMDKRAIVIDAKVPAQALVNDAAMTSQEVDDLISRINFLRTLSVPTASKMNCLEWNSTLAQKALTFARSCSTNSMESSLNIAFKMTKSQDFYIVLEDYWFAELYRIEGKTCDSDEPRNCKNWKALMNGNNNFVGCTRAQCSGNQFLYVCVFDYVPQGESFVPYQIGNPCSKCSLPKILCKDNSLCCSSKLETSETAKPDAQSGETTQKDCLSDWQCKWNEKCPTTKKCQIDGNTNHQENVRCYIDSHCHSQYVCNQYTGTCNFKGKMFEHTTDKEGEKGACTDDTECPNGYHCNMNRYTCYKESPRMISADGEDEPTICPSSPGELDEQRIVL
uniref:SCP domain-containing protein n=1 Tax=Romanomermis culicivorax TaxID=13658 RepID=A0A915KS43_ROMCU